MSTLRSIERRLYVRRQVDRDMAAQAVVATGEVPRHMEWNGIWTGYMTFAGVAIILLSFVLAVGFQSLDPFSSASWRSVGGGVLGWSLVVVLIATFLGAWVAARTPRTTRQHGMMRAVTLWGMILVTALLLTGWVAGTTIGAASQVATTAATATGRGAAAPNANANAAPAPRQSAQGALTATAPEAAATTVNLGRNMMWSFFLLALIGLGCALLGGALGGGGINLRRPMRASNPPAA